MWTARGAQSGVDWRGDTEIQLAEWGVKHHELRLDKPFFDIFIDDKNINSMDWSHFGNVLIDDIINIQPNAEATV